LEIAEERVSVLADLEEVPHVTADLRVAEQAIQQAVSMILANKRPLDKP